jgi:protein CWC15
MSQAHRPTWNPTQGRETKAGSRQVSKLSLPQYTKLKFRQPGQTSSSEVLKRDLKAELAEAERKAIEKKRKAAGLPDFEAANNGALRIEGVAEEAKRRKVDEGGVDLDKDDDSDDEDGTGAGGSGVDKGKGKAVDVDQDEDEEDDEDDDDEWVRFACWMYTFANAFCSSDDSDDEDETAALMAELAKIKQERAEEKARQVGSSILNKPQQHYPTPQTPPHPPFDSHILLFSHQIEQV